MLGRKFVFVPSRDFEREGNVSGTVRPSSLITQLTLDYANFFADQRSCKKEGTFMKEN
jgi:hypothetical protein